MLSIAVNITKTMTPTICFLIYLFLEEAMCKTNPCKNGGSCTELDSGFQCSCLPGYRGKRCQGIPYLSSVRASSF